MLLGKVSAGLPFCFQHSTLIRGFLPECGGFPLHMLKPRLGFGQLPADLSMTPTCNGKPETVIKVEWQPHHQNERNHIRYIVQ
jgi:hypothetical protein